MSIYIYLHIFIYVLYTEDENRYIVYKLYFDG